VTKRRVFTYIAIGAGVVLVLGVAVAAFASLKVPFDTNPNAGASSGPCAPQPCANIQGYIVWVNGLQIEAGLVSMQLTFKNSSVSTHAAPDDFSLVDSQQNDSGPVYYDPDCHRWPRTDFNHGAGFGPVPECFRPASTSPPLKLRWTPDLGAFCCDTVIALD
jgi:hypothetical protein